MFTQEDRKEIVESVMETVTDYPDPADTADDDVVEVTIFAYRENDTVKFALFGTNLRAGDLERVSSQVKPLVDQRKVTGDDFLRIGLVSIRDDGEIVDVHIDEEYKKPSKQEGSDA